MWWKVIISTWAGAWLAWSGIGIAVADGPNVAPHAATKKSLPASYGAGCTGLFGPHADLWANYCCQKRPEHSPVRNYHPLVRAKHAVLHPCRTHDSCGHASACGSMLLVGYPMSRRLVGGQHHGPTGSVQDGTYVQNQPVQIDPTNDLSETGRHVPPSTTETTFEPPVQIVPQRDPITLTPEPPRPVPAPTTTNRAENRNETKTGPSNGAVPSQPDSSHGDQTQGGLRVPKNLIPPRFRLSNP